MTNATSDSTTIISRVATVGDLHLSYLQAGSGKPLVLLHGCPQHSHMWRRLLLVLAQQFTVIAPDQRGAGGSSKPDTGYDKRTMANDIYQLVHQSMLRQLAQQIAADTSLNVHFSVQGTPSPLSIDVKQNLLRISQEALTNVVKHAQASSVSKTFPATNC